VKIRNSLEKISGRFHHPESSGSLKILPGWQISPGDQNPNPEEIASPTTITENAHT
jgi:hypothetical protein